jgi:hypothetical protein
MSSDSPLNLDAFATLAAQRGLTIESEDMLGRLYAGYCSLQVLLAQMPAEPEPGTDPSLIFLPDGSEISR